MRIEELKHHLAVIQSFEPLNEGTNTLEAILLVSGVGIILGLLCLLYKKGKYKVAGSVTLFTSGMMLVMFFANSLEDKHHSWRLEQGYESITLLSNFINGSDVDSLITDANKLISESVDLKFKLSLIGVTAETDVMINESNL